MTDSRAHDVGPPGTTQETQISRHLNNCWMLVKESSQCRNGPEYLLSSVLFVPITISSTWFVVILEIRFCLCFITVMVILL